MSARSARSAFMTTVLTCNDVLRLTVADSIRPRQTRTGGVRHSRCFVTLLMHMVNLGMILKSLSATSNIAWFVQLSTPIMVSAI